MSLFFTPAYAAATDASSGVMGSVMQIAPLALVFVVFYLLLIRPQQVKQKKLKKQLDSLRRGDKVITAGGLMGTVQATRPDAQEVEVEIAPQVKVRVLRRTLTGVVSDKPANDA